MTDYAERVLDMLDSFDGDEEKLFKALLTAPLRPLLFYVFRTGLLRLKGKNRQKIRDQLKPAVMPGGNPALVSLSRRSRWFQDYVIGTMAMADMTKDDLMEQAFKERRAANGHLADAIFYEQVAAPMAAGKTVKQHWPKPEALWTLREKVYTEFYGKKPPKGGGEPELRV